jgi:hypothetical protein
LGVYVAPGLRVRVVGGQEVPHHLRTAYLEAVGETETGIPPAAVVPEVAPAATEPAAPVVIPPAGESAGVSKPSALDLESLSRQDLMKVAAAEGVPAKGRSAEIIAAIRDAKSAGE